MASLADALEWAVDEAVPVAAVPAYVVDHIGSDPLASLEVALAVGLAF